MSIPASELFGVREELHAALEAAGLHTSDQVLAASAHSRDRVALAARLNIDTKEVLELANRADLARIKGVGTVYSDLLEWTGVDTVAELAQRNPANLHAAIVKASDMHFARQLPTPAQVAEWVAEAKTLERMLFY
jgi:predicted flap endonuclease-1-like 5' DNA nuclease